MCWQELCTYFLSACIDSTFDSYEELLNHLIHVHKICRKVYDSPTEAQLTLKAGTEPEVIDLDGDEEDTVNVTALEVVEINPQVPT